MSDQVPGMRQSQFKPAAPLRGDESLEALQVNPNTLQVENVNISPQQMLEFLLTAAFGGNVVSMDGSVVSTADGLNNVTY